MTLKISFSTLACPDWTWHDVLRYGVEYGYQGVEIRLLAREVDLLQVADLASCQWPRRQRELHDTGFRVCGLASSVRFDSPDVAERTRQHEIGCRYVDMAQALGAEFIRVFGDLLPPATEPDRRAAVLQQIAEGLVRLGEIAATAGVKILLETHGDFSGSPPSRDVMQRANHPAVGLVWDTHHAWRFCGEALEHTWEQLAPWVQHTHWKDSVAITERADLSEEAVRAAQAAGALMGGHQHADYVLFLGGEFPARECLATLIDNGYAGWHSLEWEKMWHPELLGPEIALPLFPRKMQELAETLAPRKS